MRVAVTFGNETRLGPYLVALEEVGIEAVRNPASLDSLDGLLLTGGSDINPARYGKDNAGSEQVDDARDALEMRLLQDALAEDLPVFAICRGLQLFNVTQPGGTLLQDMDGHKLPHHATHHAEIYEGTRLAQIFGPGVHVVNSRHHQAVAQVGEGLVISAKSPDGVIEGLEWPDLRFAVAVQWHPEDQMPQQRRLFESFREAL